MNHALSGCRLLLFFALLVMNVLPVATSSAQSSQQQSKFNDDLQEMLSLRRGRNTPFDQVEALGQKCLRIYPEKQDQLRIYVALTEIYSAAGVSHPERILNYASLAVNLTTDPFERARLFLAWGDAVQVEYSQSRGDAFLAMRKFAAQEYLKGVAELEWFDVPEKLPDRPPPIPRLDYAGPPTPEIHALLARRDALVQANNEYFRVRRVFEERNTLRSQLVFLYTRRPFASREITEMSRAMLKKRSDADALLSLVAAGVRSRMDTIGGSEIDTEALPEDLVVPPSSASPAKVVAPTSQAAISSGTGRLYDFREYIYCAVGISLILAISGATAAAIRRGRPS